MRFVRSLYDSSSLTNYKGTVTKCLVGWYEKAGVEIIAIGTVACVLKAAIDDDNQGSVESID